MISFNKINGKDTEYRLVFGNGKNLDIFLLPRKTLTNKFEIIISSIQKMSEVIGENFDNFIYYLLSKYQNFDSNENRYKFLHINLKTIVNYADFFVENNGVAYAEFANENKKSESNIFFDENGIKNIIKLSETLKIYSLCSNTEMELNKEYHKQIYNEFIDILDINKVVSKILKLLESLGEKSKKTIWRSYDNLSHYSFAKVMEAFNIITSQGITICSYKQNPIPLFVEIFNNIAVWRDKNKEAGIGYENDESQNDRDDKFSFNERKQIDLKRIFEGDILIKFEQTSYSFLLDSYRDQIRKFSRKEGNKLLKNRINQIKHISPFWEFIILPIFSKASGIHYSFLRKQSPKRMAVMSFYLAHLLKHLNKCKLLYLFNLAAYYPESEIPESTTYRLNNNFLNDDLMKTVGSRVNFVRIIENFVGKMRIRTVRYSNILTGQAMVSIDFNQIEVETIDYLTKYFSGNLKTQIEELEEYIWAAVN